MQSCKNCRASHWINVSLIPNNSEKDYLGNREKVNSLKAFALLQGQDLTCSFLASDYLSFTNRNNGVEVISKA